MMMMMLQYNFLEYPTPDQISQITVLYRTAGWWPNPEDDPELVARMVAGSHCFMTVNRSDEIIAMGRAISDRASDAYIQDVTVKPEYRRRGIGSTVINKLTERLRRDGLAWIGLIAERGSHGFYRPIGFEPMPDSLPMLLKR